MRGPKVAKVTKSGTGVGAAKEKKALDYGSDDFSSSSGDNLTLKATMGKHSIKGLLKNIKEKDKIIRLHVVYDFMCTLKN